MLTYDQSMSNVVSLIFIVIPIILFLEDINDDEKTRILNELKTEINSGLVNIKFKQASSGSLIIYIDILDSNLLFDGKACNNIAEALNKLAVSARLDHSCETG
jgi:hypothetical protein